MLAAPQVETNYAAKQPTHRGHLNKGHVTSGQLRCCPCCGRTGLLKRTVDYVLFIHEGVVTGQGVNTRVIASSDYCKLSVYGKKKDAKE